AAMTGAWEARLQGIARGKEQLAPFMKGIEDYVTRVVGRVPPALPPLPGDEGPKPSAPSRKPASPAPSTPSPPVKPTAPVAPVYGGPRGTPEVPLPLDALLRERFGFSAFRAHQRDVCEAASKGADVLLVMPTGAGKSLCYQLPGLARGGTTLVLSPLIALMEDQVGKLRELGLRAERIHSGRERSASRQACVDYLAGRLDYLFIAPERLSVPGFPEMLAKRTPALIAVDEAHCISQ